METSRGIRKEERRKETNSNEGEKVFCLWMIQAYGL